MCLTLRTLYLYHADSHSRSTQPLRRNTVSASNSDTHPRSATIRRSIPSPAPVTSPKAVSSPLHAKSVSTSSSLNGHHSTSPKPSSPKPFSRKSSSPRPQISARAPMASGRRSPTPDRAANKSQRSIPDYLSPIHRPSVNPSFNIDARTGSDFAPGTNLSGHKMIVEIWARQPDGSLDRSMKGKGKEKANWHEDSTADSEWKVLETWDVDLNDLLPINESVCALAVRWLICELTEVVIARWRYVSHATKHAMRRLRPPWAGVLSATQPDNSH